MPISPSWQFALSTPVTRFAMGGGRVRTGNGGARRKRRKAAPKRAAKRKTRTKSRVKKAARLVKGSRAAKAYMAKIRGKRAKKR